MNPFSKNHGSTPVCQDEAYCEDSPHRYPYVIKHLKSELEPGRCNIGDKFKAAQSHQSSQVHRYSTGLTDKIQTY